MKKSLLSLAFGGFGLGMTEFVMMGILPDIAKELNITISEAAHFIFAYAMGVGVGALLLILSSRIKFPKHILLAFMALFTVFNSLSSLANGYLWMSIIRFLAGFSFGVYFGVGAVVAVRIVGQKKAVQAISIMLAGLMVVNLAGVPFGNYISDVFSWRYTFVSIGLWGVIVLYFLYKWIPDLEETENNDFKRKSSSLKSFSPWVLMLVTTVVYLLGIVISLRL